MISEVSAFLQNRPVGHMPQGPRLAVMGADIPVLGIGVRAEAAPHVHGPGCGHDHHGH
jgi:hypothetical protein